MRSALLMSTSSTATARSCDSSLAARSAVSCSSRTWTKRCTEPGPSGPSRSTVTGTRCRPSAAVDDVRGDLAQIQRPAGEVPERPLASNRLVHGAQRLGGERGVRRVELDAGRRRCSRRRPRRCVRSAPRRASGRPRHRAAPRRPPGPGPSRPRNVREAMERRGLVVTRGKREPGYRVEMGPPQPPRTILATRRRRRSRRDSVCSSARSARSGGRSTIVTAAASPTGMPIRRRHDEASCAGSARYSGEASTTAITSATSSPMSKPRCFVACSARIGDLGSRSDRARHPRTSAGAPPVRPHYREGLLGPDAAHHVGAPSFRRWP